jgi:hypothetical protein
MTGASTMLAFRTSASSTSRSPHQDSTSLSLSSQLQSTTSIAALDGAGDVLLPCQQQQQPSPFVDTAPDSITYTVATGLLKRIPTHGFVIESSETSDTNSTSTIDTTPNALYEQEPEQQPQRRPRSGSEGLDYLALLAEQERRAVVEVEDPMMLAVPTTVAPSASNHPALSDSDDSEIMPPPQPRRPRSTSNPEYMQEWSRNDDLNSEVTNPVVVCTSTPVKQQHFVLPPSLLRKELAEARGAVNRKAAAAAAISARSRGSYTTWRSSPTPSIPEDSEYLEEEQQLQPDDDDYYVDDSCEDDDDDDNNNNNNEEVGLEEGRTTISSTELLRRARARLLEDLSECNLTGDKSVMILPHSLTKYSTVRV